MDVLLERWEVNFFIIMSEIKSSFGSYYLDNNNIFESTLLPPGSFVISDLSTFSKKGFSNSKSGFIKYKSHKTADIKIDVSVNLIMVSTVRLLKLSIIKTESPSISFNSAVVFGKIFQPNQQTFSGQFIFKNVKHGDYFAIVMTNTSTVNIEENILNASLTLTELIIC